MSSIKGPLVHGGFQLATMQTAAGRTQHVAAVCAAARVAFEREGTVPLSAWIWTQTNPSGVEAPAILRVELHGDPERLQVPAFEQRVLRACGLGKALAVATVCERPALQVLEVQFECIAGSEIQRAKLRASEDPLRPGAQRRVLEPFARIKTDGVPERFRSALHS